MGERKDGDDEGVCKSKEQGRRGKNGIEKDVVIKGFVTSVIEGI